MSSVPITLSQPDSFQRPKPLQPPHKYQINPLYAIYPPPKIFQDHKKMSIYSWPSINTPEPMSKQNAKKILRMNTSKYLTKINLKDHSTFKQIFQHRQPLKRITCFNLTFSVRKVVRVQELAYLQKILLVCPNIKTLSIKFRWCKSITDFSLTMIPKAIKGLRKLDSLQLSFLGCSFVTNKSLNAFGKAGKRLEKLRKIDFDFKWCGKILDIGEMTRSLSYMSNLQQLSLSLPNMPNSNLMRKSFEDLASKKTLLHLQLIFNSMNGVTDGDIETLGESLLYIESLQSLNLKFFFPTGIQSLVTDRGLESLGISLGYSKNIESINLGLGRNNAITDNGIEKFMKPIEKHKAKLRKLSIYLEECDKTTEKGIYKLSKCLRSFKDIEMLDVSYRDSELRIPELAIQEFGQVFENFPKLRYLGLKLENCKNIGNIGMETLGTSLSQLSGSLEHLVVELHESNTIRDEGLGDLAEGIACLKKLKYLSLDIYNFSDLTDRGINKLGQAIGELEELRRVGLKFVRLDYFHDDGLAKFGSDISVLRKLNEIKISLRACKNLTNGGLKRFTKSLAGTRSLYRVKLSSFMCGNINGACIKELRQNLPFSIVEIVSF